MSGTYLIPQDAPGLGRHVNHDPRSRRYSYPRAASASYRPPAVFHARHIPIFDQSLQGGPGGLGDCTANTGLGIMATGPYWDALCAVTQTLNPSGAGPYPFTGDGCVALYEDTTANDPFDGQYPPTDTGSDGLSTAKALVRAGVIPGYQHTFALADALHALATYPLAVGTVWTQEMFYPAASGLIRYTGAAVGGHEWVVDQYVPDHDWVGGTTSWGASFGVNGRFYLTVADFGKLLANDGDVTVFTPPTAPAPVPTPEPTPGPSRPDDADRALDAAHAVWRAARGL